MKLTKEFRSRLDALKTAGLRKQYEKAYTILGELNAGLEVTQAFRPDTRIPNSRKFELPDGYRIVFQIVEGAQNEHLALFVGSHDEVEYFLNNHRGWIFDPKKHTLKVLRADTVADEKINVVRSADLQTTSAEPQDEAAPVFAELSDEQLEHAGLAGDQIQQARTFTDPDDFALIGFLDQLESTSSSKLLAFVTGSRDERSEVSALLSGQRELVSAVTEAHLPALEKSSDIFVDLADIPEEKRAFESYPFDDWMLYLHPDQKPLASRQFNGPARLRGVSGSGKTVVAIHRARHCARRLSLAGSAAKVLFLTYNRSLADLVGALVSRLCTADERDRIQVSTLSKWCQGFISFSHAGHPYWDENQNAAVFREVVIQQLENLKAAGFFQPGDWEVSPFNHKDFSFLSDEIDYIYGCFLHDEADEYLTRDRKGRLRPLNATQREAVLRLYTELVFALFRAKLFDPRELARVSFRLLRNGEQPEQAYAAVVVDEVQDLTEMELRLVKELGGEAGEGLFLVGDDAQRIYKRGHSLLRVGINVVGRSFVLRKNYRNSREIFTAAHSFKEAMNLGAEDLEERGNEINSIPPSSSGEKPLFMIANSPAAEYAAIVREVKYLTLRLHLQPNQICCMARNEWVREGIRKALEQSGVKAANFRVEGNFQPDAVPVSTLHNSKGHEFRAVFIAGLFDGAVPLTSGPDEQTLEQEASLFYVAMTRAKELLYLSYSKTDSIGRQLKQSRFLELMKPNLDTIELPS